MIYNHLGSCFVVCQLLCTGTKCNEIRNDLYVGGMDAYDVKFKMSVFQPSLFKGLPVLTIVVLRGKS
jgi:hypothetical protein